MYRLTFDLMRKSDCGGFGNSVVNQATCCRSSGDSSANAVTTQQPMQIGTVETRIARGGGDVAFGPVEQGRDVVALETAQPGPPLARNQHDPLLHQASLRIPTTR